MERTTEDTTERMTERTTRLDLPLLLPEVGDAQDACVDRLVRLLERRAGVARVHVLRAGEQEPGGPAPSAAPQLCLHYDPERLSLARVTELARTVGAEVTDQFGHVVLGFRAVGTEDDGRRIEERLRALPGVTSATVNYAAQMARVEFDRGLISRDGVERALADVAGAPAEDALTADIAAGRARANGDTVRGGANTRAPRGGEVVTEVVTARTAGGATGAGGGEDHADDEAPAGASWYRRNRELAWSLISGALLLAGWLVERAQGVGPVAIAIFVLAYVFGARDNVGHFVKDLRQGHVHFNIDLLMVVAALGAAALGEWAEGALLLFLFSLGHALEHYALGRARNAIKALAELAPSRATVLRGEGGVRREEEVPIEAVRPGDLVVVRPAERLPVDGTVAEGRSAVNQAPITGESVPVDKAPGEAVFAGSVNGEGALVVTVTTAVGDRTLDRVVKLVAEAQTQKAPTQQFTDRFERVFVPTVLVGTALLILAPPLFGVWEWRVAFYRAMTLLVAASPCALALGTPAAVLAGIAQAARNGVLIKGGAHLETLGAIDVLALDKTGTITVGEPSVTDVVPAAGVDDNTLLAIAAAVERRSQHPLAKAVVRAAEQRALQVPEAGELESVTGKGVRARVGDGVVEIGRLLMFEGALEGAFGGASGNEGAIGTGAAVPPAVRDAVARLEQNGRSTMVVRRRLDRPRGADAPEWLGVLGLADEPRADVGKTLDALRAAGVRRIEMLTGDNAGVGNAVGRVVGVDAVRAGLLPEDKVTAIRELAAQGQVAMVGDGVNDAPALANATVGIAMGGAGTAAALETADVALMGDDLGRLPFAIGLSRQARRVIRQNLYVSLGVIALLIVASVTGLVGIGPAVIVHEGSTLVVIANALRLLAYRGGDGPLRR
jgi:Cd2+/Zn2+-exporting ATPase